MSEKQQLLIQNQSEKEKENKIIEYDNIKYLINDEENAAGVIGCEENLQQIHIPRSIKQGTKEYNVTYIMENAFKFSRIKSIIIPSSVTLIGEGAFYDCEQLETIEIPNDSKLKTIDKNAFSRSKIKRITIPSELVDLKEGWCGCTTKLTEIIVSPNNPRYCLYEDNMILGKTIIEENNYENLIFCSRNIKHIKIPNFIKHICSYSFEHCNQFETIEISNDSKLETIEKNAFFNSTIKSIIIPSSVTLIGEFAFSNCKQLELIEIPNDSKLKTIDKYAFFNTRIKRITIPSELVDLKEGWCFGTLFLTEIIVSPNNPRYCLYEDNMILGKTRKEENNYENLIFCCRNIIHIKIPNFIKHICSYSFFDCIQLEKIEIPNDSKLETINKYAFSNTNIKSIIIPSSVTLIGEGAFYDCEQLKTIEIPNDSKLKTIDKNAFFRSTIKRITIPSELVDLKEGWCNNIFNLTEIIVSPNNPRYCLYEDNMILGKTRKEENNYENLIFCCRNIKHIKIPNFIKHICSDSFSDCRQLETIEIPNDSKLETIDKYAFSWSTIKSIIIPSSVTLIGEGAFSNCYQLQIIEINNKEMISKCQSHFKDCLNAILMIPVDF